MTDTRQVDAGVDMESDGAEWTLVHSADCIPAAEAIPSDAAGLDEVAEGAQGNVEAAPLEDLSQAGAASLQGTSQHQQQQEQQEQQQLEAILADSAAATAAAVATVAGADPAAAEPAQEEASAAAEPAHPPAEPAQDEEAPAAAAPTAGTLTYVAATSPWLSWMACLLGTACPPTCAPGGTHTHQNQAQTELGAWLASAGDMVGSMVEEVRGEWTELAALIGQAVNTGQGVAAQQVKAFRVRMGKAMHGNTWVLLSLGAVTAVACIAMGTLVLTNHRLAHQLRQRDKELARLLLRTMRLQETLQSSCAAVPVLRLTSLQPAFAVSSLG